MAAAKWRPFCLGLNVLDMMAYFQHLFPQKADNKQNALWHFMYKYLFEWYEINIRYLQQQYMYYWQLLLILDKDHCQSCMIMKNNHIPLVPFSSTNLTIAKLQRLYCWRLGMEIIALHIGCYH